jgi:hypothetical protein
MSHTGMGRTNSQMVVRDTIYGLAREPTSLSILDQFRLVG